MRGREVREMRRKRCLHALAPKTNKPFVVFVDGQAVLRKDWDMVVGGDQIVTIMMLPQGGGGGGSDPMRTLLMIAVVVASFVFGPEVGLALGFSGTTAAAVGQALVMVGGSMLVNAVVPPPTANTALGAASIPSASPTYNIQAQGNAARIGQAIPVQYGRLRVYPDFAAQPYVEYLNNDQYLYQFFCIGQGEYDIESIQIGDSSISGFNNVSYEIVRPNGKLTLFPINVQTSSEVSGQELTKTAWLGPFVVNSTQTNCTKIGIDLVCPRGLYYANDNGSLSSKEVVVQLQARTIDQNGNPIGAWTTLVSDNYYTEWGAWAYYSAPTLVDNVSLNWSAGVATFTKASHGLSVGQTIYIFNGNYGQCYGTVLSVPSSSTFTASLANSLTSQMRPGSYSNTQYATLPTDTITEQYQWSTQYSSSGSQTYGIERRTRTLINVDAVRISGATTTPIRKSFTYDMKSLGSGMAYPRFEVRAQRYDTKDDSTRAGHEVDWAGLRAYFPDQGAYGNLTMIGVKAQATNNLSVQNARQISVVCTRKLNGVTATGLSSTIAATRSVAAAIADAAMNTIYGGGLSSANIDWAALYALDQTLAARGDYLDMRFDNASTLWDVLTQIGAVARTKPYMQGGILHVARDQAASVPVALFSMRNIVQGSMSVQYLTPTSQTADSVQVTYFDKTKWQQTTITCQLANGTSNNPAKISMLGITERDQAFREGLYQAAANQYRRKVIKFSTECEGFIPSFGDLIAIQHDMPAWGQVGEVTAWDSATKTLTVNEQLTWTPGQTHYVGLRKRDGSIAGPYQVTQGASANILVLAVSPSFTPYTGMDEERTHIAFGYADTWRQPARVVSVVPRGPYQVEITAVNEDASVHTADTGLTAPALNYSELPKAAALPTVTGLGVVIDVTGATPQYVASWNASPGADHYVCEISWDGGSTWSALATEYGTQHRWQANRNASASVRVAGVNLGRGAWSTVSVNYSAAPSTAIGFNATQNGNAVQLTWSSNPEIDVVGYEVRTSDSNWGTDGALFRGAARSATATPPVAGTSQTYYLRAIDFLGNYSAASTSTTFTSVAVTNIASMTATFSASSTTTSSVTLSWADVAPQFGLAGYQVSYGSNNVTVKANTITLPADWLGNRTFTIKTIDTLGNVSSGYSQTVTKLSPNSPTNFRAQVVDNTVMLYWGQPAVTTLPVSHYLLRRGPSWASADVDFGRKDGMFTSVNETQGGNYTYWISTVDTDGNLSTAVSVSAVVAQPPDFVFFGQFTSTFTGTKSSAILENGAVVLPVNTTETFAQHFTSRSWAGPSDQIAAGFPVFIQPSNSPGYYEETFDFGTVLASSRVSVAYSATTVAGTPTMSVTISTSSDGSTWLDNTGSTQIFATSFRYVKVRLTATDADGLGIFTVSALSVTLDAKLKNDAGMTSCVSTDANGTVANFNVQFVDVTSITVTPAGTTPVTAVYDFKDAVIAGTYSVTSNVCTVNATAHGLVVGQNVRLSFTSGTAPSGVYTVTSVPNANSYTVALTTANTSGNVSTYSQGLRIYLFNSAGTRVSGTASWSIKGY
jgi:hypothetical protein